MKRIYMWDDTAKELVEVTPESGMELHFIQPDIAAFQGPDGVHIGGRSQWREHLKVTGSIEMGHADIAASRQKWDKRQDEFRGRLKGSGVHEADPPKGEIRPIDRSRINREMANRLDGRPTPDRKTLIKLTLETARDLARRG